MSSDMKFVSVVVGLAVLAIVGFFIFGKNTTPSDTPIEPSTTLTDAGQLVRSDSPVRGPADAKVTIVEFADFQCPACKNAVPVVEEVLAKYPTQVKLIFRHFPISSIHQHADETSLAGEAAKNQGKFWEWYGKMYEKQGEWSVQSKRKITEFLANYAKDLGLDTDKYTTDKTNSAARDIVARDLADADALGVDSTPTFFVNGKQLSSVNDLAAAVAEAAK
jgi:protein-disulfide isomerase